MRCAVDGLVFLECGRFPGGADVLRARFVEDVLGLADFIGVLGVNREEEIARLNLAFVTLGFDLGNAHPD